MQLKIPYEIMKVEGQYFAVPMENCEGIFNGVVRLTKSAAVIFELLQEETDEESIVAHMSQRYNVSEDILAADVHNIVTKLKAKGLLA